MKTKTMHHPSDARTLFSRVPQLPGLLCGSFALALAVQLVSLVPPLLMRQIIDVLIPTGNLHQVTLSVLLFIAIPLVMTAGNTLYKYLLAIVARRSGRALTVQAFANVLQQRMDYFDRQQSGELATFVRQQTMKYVMFWLADLPQLVASMLVCGVIIVYIGRMHWLLAVLLCAYFPLAYLPSNHFGKVVSGLTGRIIAANAKMAQTITDSVRAIRLVKAFQLERRQENKLNAALTSAVGVWSKVAFFDNLNGLWVSSFVNQLVLGVVFVAASALVIDGQMTIGGIVIVLSYLTVFYANAATVLTANYEFKKQLAEFKPLAALLNLDERETGGSKGLGTVATIAFDHVRFAYTAERGPILRDFSLRVNQGQWVGLVGPSGAGKSTVFDLLLRFYSPQAGQITLNGMDIANYRLPSLRQQVTLVAQNVTIFPGTVRDNLLVGNAQATDAQLQQVLVDVELADFVAGLPAGLDTPIGEDGNLLSGGQRQRLNLAQGLLRNSSVLLLDEITSALDPATTEAIRHMIDRVRRERGLTVIAISHTRTFLDQCDVVYALKDGQLVNN